MTIATDFNTPTTGYNARAEALAAAAVAAYDTPNVVAVEAVIAERGRLAAAIISTLLDDTTLRADVTHIGKWAALPGATGYESSRPFVDEVHALVDECALSDVLLKLRAGAWSPADANGYNASTAAAAGVAKIAALESRYAAKAA